MIKKIAILTSGGDAPGMNSAIRGVYKAARSKNIEVLLVREGFKGLCENNFIDASQIDLDFWNCRGGTCIFTSRHLDFRNPLIHNQAIKNIKDNDIDALVVIGGDGSFAGAQLLYENGINVIAIPATIDNDINSSDYSIGYDTALNTIVRSIDSIRDTSDSHKRIVIVEVMGNRCGDLALYSGLATGAEIISISEAPLSYEEIAKRCAEYTSKYDDKAFNSHKINRSIIVVVSEKLYDLDKLRDLIASKTSWSTRYSILGYIQRGGNPTAQERVLASLMGIKAIDLLCDNQSGIAICARKNDLLAVPLLKALSQKSDSKKKARKKAIKFNDIHLLNA
ncbi:ATP-dependent 6-phosphofructokinase [Mycoplasmopsis gallinarum]|uniref:6-phosphofructokinase n=1 Tax=Mycoplasmopsis gallinarum TaxID=29557 RepID=A0A168RPB5_9BACT|nr:ATP-dependent 6-phosphofructokinase [Mycoplasmopsis gallinarum]OAB49163.1 6-phosphofructokinase [Mycoplasmopsis gallinarum]